MKVENMNLIIQGTQNTLNMVCGEGGKLGKISVKGNPYKNDQISVIIGVVGDLKGELIFTMDRESGLYLASKIMVGFDVPELNDMAKSAVSELANMISGNAASALFSGGVNVDITPPVFVSEGEIDKFGFVKPGSKIICMPMQLTGGRAIEINLHLS